jgi:stage V sporulation protein SpoVS
MNELCVSAATDPTAAGGAVEGEVREAGVVEIQAINARA